MDDYVMVPREPTEEMVLNGVRAFQHAYSETDVLEDWKDCYRAMIATAPVQHTKITTDYERGFDDGFILRKEKDGKRPWVGLTEEEKYECYLKIDVWSRCVEAVEAKLKDKNT